MHCTFHGVIYVKETQKPLQIGGRTVFPRWMAFTNVLILYGVLKGISLLMPVSAFRLGFTNGLMSESMIVWFGIMLIRERKTTQGGNGV